MLQTATKTVSFAGSKYRYNLISLICYQKQTLPLLIILLNLFIFNSKPIFAQSKYDIAINYNNFKQPLAISGVSGGSIKIIAVAQTEKTSTGYCDGFTNRQPNHIFKLDNFFEYLRLEVESSTDTTILVKGVGGVWCNDDAGSANPVIEGPWQPGIYQIWVGSYQANSNSNYQIKITGK